MKLSRDHSLNDLVDKILAITKDLSACEHAQAGDDYLENPKNQARVQKYEYRLPPLEIRHLWYLSVTPGNLSLTGLTEEEIKIVEGQINEEE